MNKKKLVIVGAGFGGMYTYRSLSKKVHETYDIVIINKTNHFLFTPLLHEVATGSLEPFHVVEPIRTFISKGTTFIEGLVESIDTKKQKLSTEYGDIDYDLLVLGLGTRACFFNVPGAAEYAFPLKDLSDAVELKRHFIKKFEEAAREEDAEKRKQILSFVIVGAGPTGVELAGEAADLFFHTFDKYYEHIYCPEEVSLNLVSSGGVILKQYKKSLQKYASRLLEKNKVSIHKNMRVAQVLPDRIITEGGDILATETVVWTGGVTPVQILDEASSFEYKNNKILVDEYLKAKNTDNVYVVGDMACVNDCAYPMTAQVARQQGQCLGKNISQTLKGASNKKFTYKEQGMLASLGNFSAVADIFGFSFTGSFAWFVWRSIYIGKFISWRKRLRIIFDWTLNLFSPRDITHL